MIKDKIKKIPLLGEFAVKVSYRLKGVSPFKTSGKYWEDRYRYGGNSGAGSYNNFAEFKGEIINAFVDQNHIEKVIEFGCGDGNQLKYFNFKNYIGYDISKTAISLCQKMYKDDTSKQFRVLDSKIEVKADLTLSLDVIYHLIEDEVYHDYMKWLFSASEKYVIIYSSNYDEHKNNKGVAHIKHRKFTNWIEENTPEFELINYIANKYPDNGDGERTTFADFYIFQNRK
jgi:hypothetical protein